MNGPATIDVPPYAGLARVYDRLVGDPAFPTLWSAFRAACARHGIRFHTAADVGCGTGRFLAALRRAVPTARLYGVDSSPAMLTIARRRLAGTGTVLLGQDMRGLELPEPVDLLTCNFMTVNYLIDVNNFRSVAKKFHRNIDSGGHLVFDILFAGEASTLNSMAVQVIDLPDARGVWTVYCEPSGRGSVVVQRTAFRTGSGRWRATRETHRQRWWPVASVLHLLRAAGFAVRGMRPLAPDGSDGPRWVQITARKATPPAKPALGAIPFT